ncbi:indole-3-glycerol phosphate synthase TrpC [Bacillus gobiensis]|uniref:indole-3-glycerol phosphate synthase TrpC n=1 Tax=Bacillus gobiensis TaxID=1441095 RepID=UPI003D1CEB5F
MLNKIITRKREDLQDLSLPEDLEIPIRPFKEALETSTRFLGLIAEVKKASPSKGLIKADFQPEEIARSYERAGADCLSVLTDFPFFQGKNEYLTSVKKTVQLPILRKDFILEPIQIEESKRIGADAILLIGEALEADKLHELYLEAYEKGLDVLVEVHDQHTLEEILKRFTPEIVGINNRNLKTFQTTLEQTLSIAQLVPKESLLISESGISSAEDLLFVEGCGAKAVLVGESLMRKDDQLLAIQDLFGESKNENA